MDVLSLYTVHACNNSIKFITYPVSELNRQHRVSFSVLLTVMGYTPSLKVGNRLVFDCRLKVFNTKTKE